MLVFAILLLALQINCAAAEEEEKDGYPPLLLALCCCITVALSAIYCGLTIGIMGMDTTTLEIIASAGPFPDNTYAGNILPLRRLGHQLLVMLLVGNMLTLVLTSQFIAALLNTSALIKFVASTLLILIFGEIIPMSICSNGKYALYLGSTSIPILRLSLVILYPVAKPLGMLLDWLVPHDAGDVFDREELKRLIALHSEKFASKTGIGGEESRMIIGALELKDSCVKDVMTPLDEVRMVESSCLISSSLEEVLWEWGKSRIPLYDGDRSNIIGLLYVKSLIGVFSREASKQITVGEFVQDHSIVPIALVSNQMSLLHALSMFERNHIQLAFVTDSSLGEMIPAFSQEQYNAEEEHKESSSLGKGTLCGGDHAFGGLVANQFSYYRLYSPSEFIRRTQNSSIVGIITLEDVIEKLISSQIFDEDEWGAQTCAKKNNFDLDTGEETTAEKDEEILRRINFFSFGVPFSPAEEVKSLSFDHHWSLAQFLSRTYVFFATWTVPHIIALLHEVGDIIIYPEVSDSPSANVLYTSNVPSQTFTLLLGGSASVHYDVSIETEIRSFSSLGDEVLNTGAPFIPQFTATISKPSRVIQITLESIRAVEKKINTMRLFHREPPVQLFTFGSHLRNTNIS